jgi:UDP-N-acetyl-D-galactosamine dehydrogenase
MNELSIIFNRIGINTYEVLEAAGTKWNFLKFFPGLVGGHCIGVDPYYLVHKAKELGYHPQIINAGRFLNDSMGGYVAKQTVKRIAAQNKNISDARVLVMGITFKENVSDIRNTKISDMIKELQSYNVKTDTVDPKADPAEVKDEYGIDLISKPNGNYDAVILAVNHQEYANLDEAYFLSLCNEDPVFVDIKGIYRNRIKQMEYWSL